LSPFAVLRVCLEKANPDGLRSGVILAVVCAPIIPSLFFGTFLGKQPTSVSFGFIISAFPPLLLAMLVGGLLTFVLDVLTSSMRRLNRVAYYLISAVIACGMVAGGVLLLDYLLTQGGV
jgi:hypothetical protein